MTNIELLCRGLSLIHHLQIPLLISALERGFFLEVETGSRSEAQTTLRKVLKEIVQGLIFVGEKELATQIVKEFIHVEDFHHLLVKPSQPLTGITDSKEQEAFLSNPELISSLTSYQELKLYLSFKPSPYLRGVIPLLISKELFLQISEDDEIGDQIMTNASVMTRVRPYIRKWIENPELEKEAFNRYTVYLIEKIEQSANFTDLVIYLFEEIGLTKENFKNKNLFLIFLIEIERIQFSKLQKEVISILIIVLSHPEISDLNRNYLPQLIEVFDPTHVLFVDQLLNNKLFTLLAHRYFLSKYNLQTLLFEERRKLPFFDPSLTFIRFKSDTVSKLTDDEQSLRDYITYEELQEGDFFRSCPHQHYLLEKTFFRLNQVLENKDGKNEIECHLCFQPFHPQRFLYFDSTFHALRKEIYWRIGLFFLICGTVFGCGLALSFLSPKV